MVYTLMGIYQELWPAYLTPNQNPYISFCMPLSPSKTIYHKTIKLYVTGLSSRLDTSLTLSILLDTLLGSLLDGKLALTEYVLACEIRLKNRGTTYTTSWTLDLIWLQSSKTVKGISSLTQN